MNFINKLRKYLEENREVVFSYLFGSCARFHQSKESDVDIAVYLVNPRRSIEEKLWSDIENIVGREVDLVILNRAPAILAWGIIRKGENLVIKDKKVFLDYMLPVSHEAMDFIEFNLDTWRRKHAPGKR